MKAYLDRALPRTFLFILLTGAGAAANLRPVGFDLGLIFYLGGVFSFLLFRFFPLPAALAGAALISGALWGNWRLVPLLILSLGELSFLALARKKGRSNYIGADGIFWMAAALPAYFILSRYFSRGISFSLYGSWIINGIGCITLGSLLLYGWNLLEVRIPGRGRSEAVPLGTLLFNGVTLVIISMSLLFYALENDRFVDRYADSIYNMLDREGEQMSRLVQRNPDASYAFYPMDLSPYAMAYVRRGVLLKNNGKGDGKPFQDQLFLKETSRTDRYRYLYKIPGSEDILPWQNYYIIHKRVLDEGENGYLLFSYPLYSADNVLKDHYRISLLVLLAVLYGAFLGAFYFSRLLAGPLRDLTAIAKALSREETESLGKIKWPRSTVEEIRNLVDYSQKSYGNIIERNVQLTSLNRSLEYSAHYDGLTKLPNRSLIIARLEEMIQEEDPFALVFLDLDGFKMINDTHGHRAGDVLLMEFAYRLTTLGKKDFAARLGGDEFALILSYADREDLEVRLNHLMERLVRPIDVEGELHVLHSSVGAALFPEHGLSVTALLRNADLAMYKVKTEGKRHWLIYSEDLDNALTQYEMEKSIYRAFEERQFVLFYQPQVDIRTGKIISLEALIRWKHEEKGYIPPSLFIPLAERMDIIIPIGYWVIEEAARKGRELVERGFDGVVSVNVSPRQFSETNFFIATKEILERIGLTPNHFGIEVTETMVMGNVSFTSRIISQFMSYGVRVSIDDFGTGYTSLSLLQDLNVHTLKIDQSFVEKVGQSRKNEIVLNNIINLTRELEMDIVVEGVETEEQENFFRDRACYTSQGFLHHRPLPAEELEKVLKGASDFR